MSLNKNYIYFELDRGSEVEFDIYGLDSNLEYNTYFGFVYIEKNIVYFNSSDHKKYKGKYDVEIVLDKNIPLLDQVFKLLKEEYSESIIDAQDDQEKFLFFDIGDWDCGYFIRSRNGYFYLVESIYYIGFKGNYFKQTPILDSLDYLEDLLRNNFWFLEKTFKLMQPKDYPNPRSSKGSKCYELLHKMKEDYDVFK